MQHDPMTPAPDLTTQQLQQMQLQQMQMQMNQMQRQPHKTGDRTKVAAVLLALFLGGLGAHKFYLGQAGQGILYLLFFWTFIPACVAFLEAIIYATQSEHDFDRKYNY